MPKDPLNEVLITGKRILTCKYGENGYQVPAALYCTGTDDPLSIDKFKLISGTEPSYNNLCDMDRLLQTITHIAASFDKNRARVPLIAVGVKHGNPCGAAVGDDPRDVAKKMILGDPLAIFGGLIMTNFEVSEDIAEIFITEGMPEGVRRPLDGILAPSFSETAIGAFHRKGDKCRLFVNQKLEKLNLSGLDLAPRFRYVRGGFLLQPNYTYILDLNDPELKRYGSATKEQEDDMLLAKSICDTSNSNTITIVKNGQLLSNGVGQQARVLGARLAVNLAGYTGHDTEGSVVSSDSFFPFPDAVEVLKDAGVRAIIATSGSIRDKEVIGYCEKNSIVLYHIPDSKGRGFFGH